MGEGDGGRREGEVMGRTVLKGWVREMEGKREETVGVGGMRGCLKAVREEKERYDRETAWVRRQDGWGKRG